MPSDPCSTVAVAKPATRPAASAPAATAGINQGCFLSTGVAPGTGAGAGGTADVGGTAGVGTESSGFGAHWTGALSLASGRGMPLGCSSLMPDTVTHGPVSNLPGTCAFTVRR